MENERNTGRKTDRTGQDKGQQGRKGDREERRKK